MTKNLKNWFVYSALRSSIKAAPQGNNVLVASSNKTVGAHSYRLLSSTTEKAISHRRGRLIKVHRCFSVSSTKSRQPVAILLQLFAKHCVPEIIVSDKGTQFTSHDFRELCKSDAISHILSSHVVPKSNEWAERFFDTFKSALLKL
jgi:transposase InsO family protein